MYQASIYFDTQEDSFNDGASGESANSWALTLKADTLGELRDKVLEHTCSKWADLEMGDPDEHKDAIQYWTSYLTDADNIGDATQAQIEAWEKGELKLWVVSCRILVSQVTITKAQL